MTLDQRDMVIMCWLLLAALVFAMMPDKSFQGAYWSNIVHETAFNLRCNFGPK